MKKIEFVAALAMIALAIHLASDGDWWLGFLCLYVIYLYRVMKKAYKETSL